MNRAKLVLTLLLVGTFVALLTAQQEDIRPEMRPELRAFENKVDLQTIMTPEEFRSAGLAKLTPLEMENLNNWIEGLLADVRRKMDEHIREARPIPATPPTGPKTQRKPGMQPDGK